MCQRTCTPIWSAELVSRDPTHATLKAEFARPRTIRTVMPVRKLRVTPAIRAPLAETQKPDPETGPVSYGQARTRAGALLKGVSLMTWNTPSTKPFGLSRELRSRWITGSWRKMNGKLCEFASRENSQHYRYPARFPQRKKLSTRPSPCSPSQGYRLRKRDAVAMHRKS
jgi:hypothetical protein